MGWLKLIEFSVGNAQAVAWHLSIVNHTSVSQSSGNVPWCVSTNTKYWTLLKKTLRKRSLLSRDRQPMSKIETTQRVVITCRCQTTATSGHGVPTVAPSFPHCSSDVHLAGQPTAAAAELVASCEDAAEVLVVQPLDASSPPDPCLRIQLVVVVGPCPSCPLDMPVPCLLSSALAYVARILQHKTPIITSKVYEGRWYSKNDSKT